MVRIISGHTDFATTHDVRLLRQAETNLQSSFDAVGITEEIDRSVALIGERLGWPGRQPALPRLNVTEDGKRFVLDDATRAEIERFNTLDIELYRGAVQRFAEAVSAGRSASG